MGRNKLLFSETKCLRRILYKRESIDMLELRKQSHRIRYFINSKNQINDNILK